MKEEHKSDVSVTAHVPVLLQEAIDVLELHSNDVVYDGTAGGGGHAAMILERLGPDGRYIGIDRDERAIERVRKRVGTDERAMFVCGNFRDVNAHLATCKISKVDKVLVDLGLSSDQLDGDASQGRGFSFMHEEPLLMTYEAHPSKTQLTAAQLVNEWSEESLANVIFGYGEERRARRIARAIVEAREEKPLETSTELAALIESVLGRRRGTHPATRTFQALRIAVNDELGALNELLEKSLQFLAPEGRIAVISFHSLEDRIVKRTFRDWHKESKGEILTKHPIVPSEDECAINRRARSAKLRAFAIPSTHQ